MAAHRYWRLQTTGYGGAAYCYMASIELRSTAGGSNLAVTGNGTAANSRDDGSAANAFDSNPATSAMNLGDGTQWVRWDFGAGNQQDIKHAALTNSTVVNGHATSLSFQYSDNDSTWVTTFSGTNGSTLGGTTSFIFPYGEAYLAPSGAGTVLAYGGGIGAALVAPGPSLAASGAGGADLTAPTPTLFGAARSSLGDNSFVYTAPRATLSAFGGATAKMKPPSPSLSITATVVNFGRAEIKPPAPTLSGTGTVSGTAYANLTFGFSNGGSYSLIGYGGAVASITLAGSPTIQATGTSGSIGRASLTAPLFELTASGTAQNYGSALLTAPAGALGATAQAWLVAPGATLTAIGTAVVTATYEAYAVNLNHHNTDSPVDEVTRYTNFPFTHVVRYQNSYFGANSTGLYLLEGTTDAGADISYAVKTATSDLDSPNQKTVASAYFSGRLGPEAVVTLYAGEGAGVPYAYQTPRGALAQNHREVFGKGIKQHRYYALGLSGSDVLELDNVELDVKQMNRRI